MSIAVAAASPAASADRPIRVMVVDDAVVARSLVRGWIDAEPDMKVVAALRTGRQAVDAIEHHDADVVMLDVDMPELDGISALPLLLKKEMLRVKSMRNARNISILCRILRYELPENLEGEALGKQGWAFAPKRVAVT